MRVIFLDIDGVLNCEDTFRAGRHGDDAIDREKVALLNDLVAATGAKIVVSSSWRHRKDAVASLAHVLERNGLVNAQRVVIGVTPNLDTKQASGMWTARSRGEEIRRWLNECEQVVESFVILDDDADMDTVAHRLVQTDFAHGLTLDHVVSALNLFGRVTV